MRPANPKKESPDSVDAEFGAEGIKALPGRIERYQTAKARALEQAKYMQQVSHHPDSHIGKLYAAAARDLHTCGNYLAFRSYPTIDKVRLHAASLCKKHLLCQLCAIRRASKTMAAYSDRYKAIRLEKPLLKPFMLTLTVKDGPDLLERVQHLCRALREFFKQKQRQRGSVFDCVVGAVWSIEVKRGKNSNLWHPHAHMILLCEVPPDIDAIADEWHNLTRDSFIVHMQAIQHDDGDGHIDGFLEVFKYALKFSDQSPADTAHAWLTLKGRRLIDSAGCFRGVEVPESLLDEPLEDIPYVEYFFRFISGSYCLDVGSRVPREWLK